MAFGPTAFPELAQQITVAGVIVAVAGLGMMALAFLFRPAKEGPVVGDTYNNPGRNFGHMGPINNYGKQPFEMTETVMKEVLSATDGWETFGVAPLGYNPKSARCRMICAATFQSMAEMRGGPAQWG